MALDEQPRVTLIVTPREKFSVCLESLDCILSSTTVPYRLVYVDAGSPREVYRGIADRARQHGFRHIRSSRYQTPNEARLAGLRHVDTPYVVFIDNDVVPSPGWIEPLLATADRTGAAVVSPIVCQGRPLHSVIQCAGGECGVREVERDGAIERRLFERIARQGRQVAKELPKLVRGPTGLAEFHCMLVRTDVAQQPDMIDGRILNTREHIDFCMNVQAAGGSIMLEPDSLVTYLHDARLKPSDLPYFMLRWSDDWERRSLLHLIAKWQLTARGTIGYRLKTVGWRRRQYLVMPFAERLAARMPVRLLGRVARRLVLAGDRGVNLLLSTAHGWRRLAGGGRTADAG